MQTVIESEGRPRSEEMPVPMSYRAIADDLAARIKRGEPGHRAGDRLPSYAQLADLYSVSVSTAQAAIRVLRERGLVVGAVGRGVYVASGTDG